MPEIKFRRGIESKLPVLAEGEPGFTTDKGNLYIGSSLGNIQLAKKDELIELSSDVIALESRANETDAQLADVAYFVKGLKPNDNAFDNGIIINTAIKYVWDNYKTGRVIIPSGVYYIGTRIYPYPGVRILGSGSGSNSFTTTTIFKPMPGFTDYLFGRPDNINNYLHYASLENVCFDGLNQSNGAFCTLGESSYLRDVHFYSCVKGLKLKYQSAKTYLERITINNNDIGVEFDAVHGVSDIVSLSGDNNRIFANFVNCGNSTIVNLMGLKAEDQSGTKHNPLIQIDTCDGMTLNLIGGYASGILATGKSTSLIKTNVAVKNRIIFNGFKATGFDNLVDDQVDTKTIKISDYNNANVLLYNIGQMVRGQASTYLESGTLNALFSGTWRQILTARSDGTTALKGLSGSGGSIRAQDDTLIADFGTSSTKQFRFYGGIGHQLDILTANTTIGANHEIVMVDATSGAKTITLQAADTTNKGRKYTIKKIDSSANVVTISGSVNGGTNYTLSSQGQVVKLISDGTTWQTI